LNNYSLDTIRNEIIGYNLVFDTPFGKRHLLYVDYTASGRAVKSIENKIQNILNSYGNTHTEDDYSGKYLTQLLKQSEEKIKKIINAGDNGKIIMVGSGATGALKKLQEIIGVYIPPLTKERIYNSIEECNKSQSNEIISNMEKCRPVVFIGPYEHHTNELMWRESFAEVVVINLDDSGMIDLKDLKQKISDPKYDDRKKIGSFSAGSNVTGIRTSVYKIAKICHKHDTIVFFDYAAVAPYVKIDMNKDKDSYFDAIFFSPHKFLGGPGTCGVLVFNEKIYRKDLPPTTAGGGTVVYVGFESHDFDTNIETREKAGTPPILQAIKAALVMDLKEKIGTDIIDDIELKYSKYFVEKLKKIKNVEIIGEISSDKRIPIVSFNINHKDRILHPKFVATLLNDLFGIQSRAGCSCAGPYGHILLNIDHITSTKYRNLIIKGCEGIKPGWVRINIHYTLKKDDINYIVNAIKFIASHGYLFLIKYDFNIKTGEWRHIDFKKCISKFSIENDFQADKINIIDLENIRKSYFKEAEKIALELKKDFDHTFNKDEDEIEDLKYFYYRNKI
jgi:selenocysteine lyase/cysteine desulfurase